ncbi:hypothetical protein [Thermoleophilum album]|uniref:Uncharacterized protein n=1 Tax=Thermoleophilum album TaxID=29539 RepID=A0A1H6G0U8_THEAL|nr:hypothetical protein [Thermoleophilum album]SEH16232.1 hypothetical protein SAMN02745716_2120 [Thermoleophilum album]
MTKRALTILIVAVLAIGGATAVIASSLTGGGDEPVHTLPSGETHTGEMPTGTHEMDDGTSMEGMGH